MLYSAIIKPVCWSAAPFMENKGKPSGKMVSTGTGVVFQRISQRWP